MTRDAPPLTSEILDRFRDALRAAAAPLGDEIGPGLTDAEIDRLGNRVGVAVPPELRTLWTWGTAPDKQRSPDSWDINPEFQLWPPTSAIEETQDYRLDDTVSRTTIAFAGSQDHFLLVEGDATQTVSRVILALIDDPNTLGAAPSLGALFNLWADQLASAIRRRPMGAAQRPAPVDPRRQLNSATWCSRTMAGSRGRCTALSWAP